MEWIASIASPVAYPELLDLGCGPGIYAEKFYISGYHVTGMDYSKRSIEYAIDSAKNNNMPIEYIYQNYLDIMYQEKFDVITLIYCDFGVMSNQDRNSLLKRIYQALKPGGIFILDVFTPNQYKAILDQTVVITEDSIECYNIWDHTFIKEELEEELQKAGFTSLNFYGDVAGDEYKADGNLMCAVAKKKGREVE